MPDESTPSGEVGIDMMNRMRVIGTAALVGASIFVISPQSHAATIASSQSSKPAKPGHVRADMQVDHYTCVNGTADCWDYRIKATATGWPNGRLEISYTKYRDGDSKGSMRSDFCNSRGGCIKYSPEKTFTQLKSNHDYHLICIGATGWLRVTAGWLSNSDSACFSVHPGSGDARDRAIRSNRVAHVGH